MLCYALKNNDNVRQKSVDNIDEDNCFDEQNKQKHNYMLKQSSSSLSIDLLNAKRYRTKWSHQIDNLLFLSDEI